MEWWLQKLLYLFGTILVLFGSLGFGGVFSDNFIRPIILGSFKASYLPFLPVIISAPLQTITLGLISFYAAHTLSFKSNSFNYSSRWVVFARMFLILTGVLNCVLALLAFFASLPHTLDVINFDRTSEIYKNSSLKFHIPSILGAILGLLMQLFTTIVTGTLLLYLAHRISPLKIPLRKT